MATRSTYRAAVLISLGSLLFAALHLAVEHFDGGVRSHHVLNRADLPLISNWLGLAVLPVLGWLLGRRIRRLAPPAGKRSPAAHIWLGLVGALLYGASLAAAFELEVSAATSGLFFALFLLAALLPIYRVEYVLGFVLGMTFTFGAVLPTLIASVFATLSFVLRFLFRWVVSRVAKRPVLSSRLAGDVGARASK
jgi:hypothetical protein